LGEERLEPVGMLVIDGDGLHEEPVSEERSANKKNAPILAEDRSASREVSSLLHVVHAQTLRCRLTHETHAAAAHGLGAGHDQKVRRLLRPSIGLDKVSGIFTQNLDSRYRSTRYCFRGYNPRATSNRNNPSMNETPAPTPLIGRPTWLNFDRLPTHPRSPNILGRIPGSFEPSSSRDIQ